MMSSSVRLTLVGLWIVLSLPTHAQLSDSLLVPSQSAISLEAGFAFRSDCITHAFASAYFSHAFIDDGLKDQVSDRLDRHNAFAVGFGARLRYDHRLRADSSALLAWDVSLEDRHWIHSDFTNDVFELYFRGNRAYKGRTADLSNFRFTDLHWQALKAGFALRIAPEQVLRAGLGVVRGQEFLHIRTRRGSLYTASNGDYLDADLDLDIRQQDSAGTGYDSWNGTGALLELSWRTRSKDGSVFEVGVQDLGWIAFNGQSARVPADTTYRFEGIDATELFDFSDTVRGSISTDSAFVQGFLTARGKESHTMSLPALVRARWSKNWDDGKYGCSIELQQRLFYAARPLARLEGAWQCGKRHRLHASVQYGEYTTWVGGLGYTLSAGSWRLYAESRFLSAWLNPEGRSAGAFVTLTKLLSR